MRSLITLALLLPLTALACSSTGGAASSPLPDWVDDPYAHAECHQAYQLAAVGIASGVNSSAREQARRRALDGMVSQIVVEVRSQIDVETSSRREAGDVTWDESLNEQISLAAAGELPGAQVIERWQDKLAGETYVLVAVDREDLLDQLLPAVEQSHLSASELLASTEDVTADPARTFLNAAQAFGLVSQTYGDATRAKVVAARTPFAARAQRDFDRGSALMAEASTRLASLSGSMRVEILGGDDQSGSPRGSLAEPLRARFRIDTASGSLPVADLPVRFRAEATKGPSLAAPASTDADGVIACRVTDLLPTGRSSNRILVELDVQAFGPLLPAGSLPSGAFVYRLPTPAQTAIAVDIDALFAGQPMVAGNVSEALAGHLSERGFDAETRDGLTGSSLAELRRTLGSRTQYVIQGQAKAHFSSQEQQLFLFRAQAQLEIVELATGRVQSLTTESILSAHSDEGELGAVKALRALRRPLTQQLDEEFVALFVPLGPGQD